MPRAGDPFRSVGSVKLDSTGAGQVTLAPTSLGWRVTLVSCSTSTRVKEPTFRLYLNTVSDAAFIEGSFSGSLDSSDTVHDVQAGDVLIGVWAGGDVGAVATMRVVGQLLGGA